MNRQIIRVDNKLLHQEAILPALNLLYDEDYNNANEEYLKAHEHYRFRRNKECLSDCFKSFESTIKIICKKNGWEFKTGDTASKLINLLLSNNFLPTYHENHFSALKQLLTSNIPTIRNKTAGHGSEVIIAVPDALATYMLNTTGATIRLFATLRLNILW